MDERSLNVCSANLGNILPQGMRLVSGTVGYRDPEGGQDHLVGILVKSDSTRKGCVLEGIVKAY